MWCVSSPVQITRTHLDPTLPSSPYLKIVFNFSIGILKPLRQIQALQVPSQTLYQMVYYSRTELSVKKYIAFL